LLQLFATVLQQNFTSLLDVLPDWTSNEYKVIATELQVQEICLTGVDGGSGLAADTSEVWGFAQHPVCNAKEARSEQV
jgi:hypothetical protein